VLHHQLLAYYDSQSCSLLDVSARKWYINKSLLLHQSINQVCHVHVASLTLMIRSDTIMMVGAVVRQILGPQVALFLMDHQLHKALPWGCADFLQFTVSTHQETNILLMHKENKLKERKNRP
jgi:hypothetical protein